jgi:tetraacyldisaccharide 4'-kinase
MSRPSSARPFLSPLVPLYRFALGLREFRLRSGGEAVRRLRFPVVSIGNLSAGGAGKTPLTIALAQALSRRGLDVDVLSRGYGRAGKRATCVDARGAAEEFGDEPLLIARSAEVPVYIGASRYEAGLLAESSPARPGLHMLDDGFQHRQLHRDLNILLLSRRDLEDRLLPAGNLREPLSAIHRAQVIAIPENEPELEGELKARGWQGAVWRIRRRMEVPAVAGAVVAFCGIARPGQFFEGLEAAGLRLGARMAFRDHHRYSARDLDRLQSAANDAGAEALITTEKDLVRLGALAESLPPSLPILIARLRIEIAEETAAIDWLLARIAALPR